MVQRSSSGLGVPSRKQSAHQAGPAMLPGPPEPPPSLAPSVRDNKEPRRHPADRLLVAKQMSGAHGGHWLLH